MKPGPSLARAEAIPAHACSTYDCAHSDEPSVLSRAGFNVLWAADGREALGVLEAASHEIPVVLADQRPERLNVSAGFNLARVESCCRFPSQNLVTFTTRPSLA